MDAHRIAADLIEIRYHVRIDFEYPDDDTDCDTIDTALLNGVDHNECDDVTVCTGAAHYPYVEFWAYKKPDCIDNARKILEILWKYNCQLQE